MLITAIRLKNLTSRPAFQGHSSDVIKIFFKTEIKTKTLISRPSLVFKTNTFLWCILEADRKAFFIFGRKRKCRRKWNSIYGRKRNENEDGHSFSAEKRKRKSPDNISVFFLLFHTFSHQVSPTMRRQYLVQFRVFLQVVLVEGIPLSSCTVYRYLCGIFLDDISTREQFAFLVYCYRVKQFSTIYALCFTGICVA